MAISSCSASTRAEDIVLEGGVSSWSAPSWALREHLVEARPSACLRPLLGLALPRLLGVAGARCGRLDDLAHARPPRRRPRTPSTSTSVPGAAPSGGLPVGPRRARLPPGPATTGLADAQRAALHQHGRHGPPTGVEISGYRSEAGASGLALSSSTSASSRMLSSRSSRPSLVLAETLAKIVSPPTRRG